MATTEEIRADLAEIVNEVAGIDADDVQLDKSFVDDLDVDSLSMVEVVVAAEEKFDVKIPDDEVKNLKTVGDAVAFIERAQARASPGHPPWQSPLTRPWWAGPDRAGPACLRSERPSRGACGKPHRISPPADCAGWSPCSRWPTGTSDYVATSMRTTRAGCPARI